MASGYCDNVSQYMREEIHTITRELQQVTFDNRSSTYPSYSSEHRYAENTTWVSYDHEESHIIEHRSNNVSTTQNNDTNIFYESYRQNNVSSFDGKNLTNESYQETSNGTSSDFECEECMYKEDLIYDSEYESDDHVDPEISAENLQYYVDPEISAENSEDHVDSEISAENLQYYVDPEISAENSEDHVDSEISAENVQYYVDSEISEENSEDHVSSHDDYEYSENSDDFYSEDNYEYSGDYYYDDDDDDSS